jgi:putative salt-induced outer membrane protein YdiY
MRTSHFRWVARFVAGLFILGCFLAPAFAKRKDDVIIMKNGDRLTGEIKGLQHGELTFKASYMKESMVANWDEVAYLSSADNFIVTLMSGEKLTGMLKTTTENHDQVREIQFEAEGTIRNISQPTVIRIEQREGKFWDQVRGSIDVGFSFTSGYSSTDLSTALSASYVTEKYRVGLSTSSQFSRSTEESTNRHDYNNQNSRMITQEWFAMSFLDFLNSDQQELALRSTLGGGVGKKLVQTPRTALNARSGVVYTHERYSQGAASEPVRSNGELLLGVDFSTFRFKTTDVSSEVFTFPSFTDPGRVRVTMQSNLRFELVKDLYWDFRFYENFDSRPPVNAPRNDLGITTSLGWTF